MQTPIEQAMEIAGHRTRALKDFIPETAGEIAARDAEWEAKSAARDAEIRRECAERAVAWLKNQIWGFEYDGMSVSPNYDSLRAAITGEEE